MNFRDFENNAARITHERRPVEPHTLNDAIDEIVRGVSSMDDRTLDALARILNDEIWSRV